MTNIRTFEFNDDLDDDMFSEYRLDYSKARQNPFAVKEKKDGMTVVLDTDVAAVFATSEAVNKVLRALIKTMPEREKPNASERLQAA